MTALRGPALDHQAPVARVGVIHGRQLAGFIERQSCWPPGRIAHRPRRGQRRTRRCRTSGPRCAPEARAPRRRAVGAERQPPAASDGALPGRSLAPGARGAGRAGDRRRRAAGRSSAPFGTFAVLPDHAGAGRAGRQPDPGPGRRRLARRRAPHRAAAVDDQRRSTWPAPGIASGCAKGRWIRIDKLIEQLGSGAPVASGVGGGRGEGMPSAGTVAFGCCGHPWLPRALRWQPTPRTASERCAHAPQRTSPPPAHPSTPALIPLRGSERSGVGSEESGVGIGIRSASVVRSARRSECTE